MRQYRLSPATENDLEDIWTYTAHSRSKEQAHRYVADLFTTFANLAANPGLGQPVDMLLPGYRRFRCAHHLIFYIQVRLALSISCVFCMREVTLPGILARPHEAKNADVSVGVFVR